MAGTLNATAFENEARRCINGSWRAFESVARRRVKGYLVIERDLKTCLTSQACHESEDPELDDVTIAFAHLGDDDDSAVADPNDSRALYDGGKVEFHVLYSTVYSVPELYFQATSSEGSVLNQAQLIEQLELSNQAELRSSITFKEHPVLGQLWFHLHPCNTATVLAELRARRPHEDKATDVAYLTSWSSVMGRLVGMPLLEVEPHDV
eukprot:TRINITY_DN9068_c0_g1_i3.p1 TRINITY_DN9068_c0_g1~~TRINITY_DN9068_c0_g1_i3.p1  ORF type:complete len:208 (+),score=32.14 TRINITY_DN9068_c0_g1_i3:395-1018(+)